MSYNSFLSSIAVGLAANLPATPEYPGPSLYYESDTGVVDLWNGTGWVVIATLVPAAGLNAAITASTTHTLAGATKLTGGYANVSVCANAGDAVSLPPNPRVGQEILVTNAGIAAAAVFPGESATKIDGGSAGASVTVTNAKSALFTCISAGNWQSIGMATRAA